jgi:PiT family inorganic phosphate transporter
MLTIGAADVYGLPVSTTMAANRSGLQMATIRNLIMAGC